MTAWIRKKERVLRELWRSGGWRAIRRVIEKKIFPRSTWAGYSEEAALSAPYLDFSLADIEASRQRQASFPGPLDIRSLTWFVPDFSHPYPIVPFRARRL